jgi:hypothetical protein
VQDITTYPGFFFNFALCSLFKGFCFFNMPLGQTPFDASGTVNARNNGSRQTLAREVYDDASSGYFTVYRRVRRG